MTRPVMRLWGATKTFLCATALAVSAYACTKDPFDDGEDGARNEPRYDYLAKIVVDGFDTDTAKIRLYDYRDNCVDSMKAAHDGSGETTLKFVQRDVSYPLFYSGTDLGMRTVGFETNAIDFVVVRDGVTSKKYRMHQSYYGLQFKGNQDLYVDDRKRLERDARFYAEMSLPNQLFVRPF